MPIGLGSLLLGLLIPAGFQVESAKKIHVDLSQKDDAEEKFFEESLSITESLLKEFLRGLKLSWL